MVVEGEKKRKVERWQEMDERVYEYELLRGVVRCERSWPWL